MRPGEAQAGPARDAPAALVCVEGEPLFGRRVPLDRELVLGRDPSCDVVLDGEDVSRRHARLLRTPGEPEAWSVVDLESTNGTWVNGVEVTGRRLASGDRIRLGAFVLKFLAADDAETRYHDELWRLARVDALTGVANRRALEEALPREVARARRTGAPLGIAMLDADHFKRVNDVHGHAAGDAVLAGIAARARAVLREGDLLARAGGEEFVLLLPGADLEHTAEVADRVRARVAAAPVAAPGGAVAVTISAGCATLEPDDADGAAALARADARLYEAKAAGRNRVGR